MLKGYFEMVVDAKTTRSYFLGPTSIGIIMSDIVEVLFLDDPENETSPSINTDGELAGTNRTGKYSVLMKLGTNIPQLLPVAGR